MSLSKPVAQRRSVLDFCLAPLRVQLGDDTNGEVPTSVAIDGQTLEIDAWEQGALRESMGSGVGAAKPWAALVTEGVAFRVGCKLRIADVTKNPSHAETLVPFAAAGLALSAEIRQIIDLLIVAGQVGSAKKLTHFRNKIIQDVKALKGLLADAEFERAQRVSEDLVGPPQKTLPVSSSIGPSPKGAGEYKPRSKTVHADLFDLPDKPLRSTTDSNTNRVRRMSLLLFMSTLIWMVFFMPRLFEPRAQVLEKLQFNHLPAVSTVMARPPSLYVEVRPKDWDALNTEERQGLIEEIGRIAVDAKYNGVQVKKEYSGTVVGRWLRAQGAELISGS